MIDLRRVTGMDASAVLAFDNVLQGTLLPHLDAASPEVADALVDAFEVQSALFEGRRLALGYGRAELLGQRQPGEQTQ